MQCKCENMCVECVYEAKSNEHTRHTQTTRLARYTRMIKAFYHDVCCVNILYNHSDARVEGRCDKKKKHFTHVPRNAQRNTSHVPHGRLSRLNHPITPFEEL